MRILSQNGEYDLPYESIILEKMRGNEIYGCTIAGSPFKLATYSSDKKVEVVMKMVQKAYTEPAETMENYYFQFPWDNEVEV